jgi:DNA polymerase (family X)
MKNKEIAEIFNRMGTLLEMQEENVFKVRAYYKAAETIAGLGEDIENIKKENRLREIPGIGEALQEKIIEYLDTGRMTAYEKLIQNIPETIFDIISIPSVGPKKAKLFFDQLNIKTVADLKKAAETGRLLKLAGVRAKTVENILNGIKILQAGQERMDLATANQLADTVVAQLKKIPKVKKIIPAGSLRRGKETVRDIDILLLTSDPKTVMNAFVSLPQVLKINAHGETKSSIITTDNIQVDLRVVDSKCFGAALLYFTGSKNFNVRLRQIAKDRGMKVNEYGIFKLIGDREKFLAGKTESECFRALGLPDLPPELREDLGEEIIFQKGMNFQVPPLIELKDIRGDLHVHSHWSDGKNSIVQLAQAAQQRGYEYLAISDHSERLKVARGLTEKDILAKRQEIERLNKKLKSFRILMGTEVEIDGEGNLDYADKVLKEFDIVIAAIHSHFEQDSRRMTQRLVKVCQNKHVHIIAHPTGVQRSRRVAYDIDLQKVARVAKETNTCLEINAFPMRFDLNSSNAYFAREQGGKFAINTDTHELSHLDFMRFGVTIARRAWVTRAQVLNTQSADDLLKSIKK